MGTEFSRRTFSGSSGIGGILWPDLGVSSGIGGVCDLALGFLLCRVELGHPCLEGLDPYTLKQALD